METEIGVSVTSGVGVSVGRGVSVVVGSSAKVGLGNTVASNGNVMIGEGEGDGADVAIPVAVAVVEGFGLVIVGDGFNVGLSVGEGTRVETSAGDAPDKIVSLLVTVRPRASRYFTYTALVPSPDGRVHANFDTKGCHCVPAKSGELEIWTCVAFPIVFAPSPLIA